MVVLVTGLGSALLVADVVEVLVVVVVVVEAEDVVDSTLQEGSNLFLHLFQTFVIVVESLAILPKIATFKRMVSGNLAITAAEVAILQRTARSQERRGSSAATTVANQATLPVTVTMLMSRNVILVGSLVISRKTAPK